MQKKIFILILLFGILTGCGFMIDLSGNETFELSTETKTPVTTELLETKENPLDIQSPEIISAYDIPYSNEEIAGYLKDYVFLSEISNGAIDYDRGVTHLEALIMVMRLMNCESYALE